jgi:hypothetical protein
MSLNLWKCAFPIGTVWDKANLVLEGFLLQPRCLRCCQGCRSIFMTYLTGDIPVGAYDPTRIANIGIVHGAIDSGGGYTYYHSLECGTGGERQRTAVQPYYVVMKFDWISALPSSTTTKLCPAEQMDGPFDIQVDILQCRNITAGGQTQRTYCRL